jgi:hypothetical protein
VRQVRLLLLALLVLLVLALVAAGFILLPDSAVLAAIEGRVLIQRGSAESSRRPYGDAVRSGM